MTWVSCAAERDLEAGDGESFLDEPVDGALFAHQELLLRELGVKISAIWDELRAGLAERIGDGIDQRRLMLMRVLEHRQIALTERAWSWVDAEQEEPNLTLLILTILIALGSLEWNGEAHGHIGRRDLGTVS
ncbi:MAG: hypothetical protein GVY22_00580 [Gammaproteobacteria bacterium]|nr:hypothetical protein [Gammaproteobacteria bacterium]